MAIDLADVSSIIYHIAGSTMELKLKQDLKRALALTN